MRTKFLSPRDILYFFVVTLVSAFVFSDFRYLGLENFVFLDALFSLANNFLVFFVLYAIFILVQKIVGHYLGLKVVFDLFYAAPIISLGITFLSFGLVPFIYTGGVIVEPIKRLRIGKFRPALSSKELFAVGLSGPLSMLLVSLLVFQPLFLLTELVFFELFLYFAAVIMFFSTLPLPGTNAINILIYSRVAWLLTFMFGLSILLLIVAAGFIGYLIALILSLIMAFLFKEFVLNKFLY